MAKKSSNGDETTNLAPEVWVRPSFTLKGDRGERAWENGNGVAPSNARLLELADLALGLKKPEPKKKQAAPIHSSQKTEPYSR